MSRCTLSMYCGKTEMSLYGSDDAPAQDHKEGRRFTDGGRVGNSHVAINLGGGGLGSFSMPAHLRRRPGGAKGCRVLRSARVPETVRRRVKLTWDSIGTGALPSRLLQIAFRREV